MPQHGAAWQTGDQINAGERIGENDMSGEISGETLAMPAAQVAAAPIAGPISNNGSLKLAFPPPSPVPTQVADYGVRFDFNDGCRIVLPDGQWRVTLRDIETGNTLFETDIGAGTVVSSKKYFVPFQVEVHQCDRTDARDSVFTHNYDAGGREVLIQFPVGTLGDLMGWFPYAVKFQGAHGCKLTCAMSPLIIPLFRDAYPGIEFVTHEQIMPERYYATYNIGLFFDDVDHVHQPCDFRHVGLHRTAGYILGVNSNEIAPNIVLEDESRPIDEPYVCIAVQSSTQCKYWNHPTGWRETVKFLRNHGYRVICIDQRATHGSGLVWNHIPHGAEDQTGDRSLLERARWLRHAEFFVGLSSGLAWLAWACRTPVAMISGFTHENNEFETPYRVINYHTCNSCWNDVRYRFDHQDFFWCPRQKDTPRQFECTRLITPEQVQRVLRRIPGFGRHAASI